MAWQVVSVAKIHPVLNWQIQSIGFQETGQLYFADEQSRWEYAVL